MSRLLLRSFTAILGIAGLVAALLLSGCGHDEEIATTEEALDAASTPSTDVATSEPEAAEPFESPDAAEPPGPRPTESSYATVDGRIEPGEYAHEMRLGGMDVHWASDAELLRIGLSAPGTGLK